MTHVDLMFVVSSKRGRYVLEDIAAALRWACTTASHYTLCIDESQREYRELRGHYEIRSPVITDKQCAQLPSGFSALTMLEAPETFRIPVAAQHVVLLSDRCLLTGVAFDRFLLERLSSATFGAMGVEQSGDFEDMFSMNLPILGRNKLNHQAWENPPPVLADDILVLSDNLLAAMRSRQLFTPGNCGDWSGTLGAYVAWVSVCLGLPVVSWGYGHKALPPLYVNTTGVSVPPPHILSPAFQLFAPVDKVLSYAEADLRDMYKRLRGEPAREVKSFGPVATIGPQGIVG